MGEVYHPRFEPVKRGGPALTPFQRGFYNAGSRPPTESHTKGNPAIRPAVRRLFPIAVFSLALSAAPGLASGSAFRATTQDARGATFEITPQAVRFDSVSVDGAPYVRVSAQGAAVAEEPG